jgi:hypothetical protein
MSGRGTRPSPAPSGQPLTAGGRVTPPSASTCPTPPRAAIPSPQRTIGAGAWHRDATRLRQWCETEGGVTLGIGLGMSSPGDPEASGALRVAHMGHVNAHMTLGALAVMQAGLTALGIPHGAAGLTAATAVIARKA